ARIELGRDRAGRPDLLDHLVAAAALDDPLDAGRRVAGQEHEAPRPGADLLVLAHRQRDPLCAARVAALAEKLLHDRIVLACDLPDALVDLAEERLVLRKPLVGRRHRKTSFTLREPA